MPLCFIIFYVNRAYIQYLYIYTTRWVPSCCPHGFRSVEGDSTEEVPSFELGSALLQADALPSEPRRTLILTYLWMKYFFFSSSPLLLRVWGLPRKQSKVKHNHTCKELFQRYLCVCIIWLSHRKQRLCIKIIISVTVYLFTKSDFAHSKYPKVVL